MGSVCGVPELASEVLGESSLRVGFRAGSMKVAAVLASSTTRGNRQIGCPLTALEVISDWLSITEEWEVPKEKRK